MFGNYFVCHLCDKCLKAPTAPPCNHIFCENCLISYFLNEAKCPKCDYRFPEDVEPSEVSRPHPISNLIERMERMDEILRQPVDYCSVNSRGCLKFAEWHCSECDSWLCDICQENHNKFLQLHNVESSIMYKFNILCTKFNTAVFCPHHEGKLLEMFCSTCQTVVCQLCLDSVHLGHDSCDLKTMIDQDSSFLKCMEDKIEENESLKQEYGRLQSLEEATERVTEEIVAYVDQTIRYLEVSKERYIKELNTSSQNARLRQEMNISEMKQRRAQGTLVSMMYCDMVQNANYSELYMVQNVFKSLYEIRERTPEKKLMLRFPSFQKRANFPFNIGKLNLPGVTFVDENIESPVSDENYCFSPTSGKFEKEFQGSSPSLSSKSSGVSSSRPSPDTQKINFSSRNSGYPLNIRVGGSANLFINKDKESTYIHLKQLNHDQQRKSRYSYNTITLKPHVDNDDNIQYENTEEKQKRQGEANSYTSIVSQISQEAPSLPSRRYSFSDYCSETDYAQALPKSERNEATGETLSYSQQDLEVDGNNYNRIPLHTFTDSDCHGVDGACASRTAALNIHKDDADEKTQISSENPYEFCRPSFSRGLSVYDYSQSEKIDNRASCGYFDKGASTSFSSETKRGENRLTENEQSKGKRRNSKTVLRKVFSFSFGSKNKKK